MMKETKPVMAIEVVTEKWIMVNHPVQKLVS